MREKISKLLALLLVTVVTVTGCGTALAENTESVKNEVNEKEVASSNDTGAEDVDSNASDEESTDDVGDFTIRVGVCAGEQNQVLKIVDDHTGLFKNQGIDVQTTEFAAGINTLDAITTGQLDIGNFADYAGINRIGNTSDNTDLRIISAVSVNTLTELYVNPEKIKEPEDLYNANLVSQAGVVYEYFYGKLFEKFGIDESKIELVNVGSTQEALALAEAGTGDAWWANKQTQGKLEAYGWVPFVSLADVDAPQHGFLMSSESYVTEHSAELQKFLKVSEEGIEYIYDNLDEVAQWVTDETGLDKDLFVYGWESDRHYYRFIEEDIDDLKTVKDWCFKNGRFDKDYNVDDFVNVDALRAVDPENVDYEPGK